MFLPKKRWEYPVGLPTAEPGIEISARKKHDGKNILRLFAFSFKILCNYTFTQPKND
jgi:hypothetical protein